MQESAFLPFLTSWFPYRLPQFVARIILDGNTQIGLHKVRMPEELTKTQLASYLARPAG